MRGLRYVLAATLFLTACVAADDAGSTSSVVSSPTSSGVETAPSTATTITAEVTTTTIMTITTTTVTVPDVRVIADGQAMTVEGPERFAYQLGDEVEISVLVDVADEIHVHGYDLHFDVAAGEVTLISFIADVPGIFEVELEENHLLLFDLEVAGS